MAKRKAAPTNKQKTPSGKTTRSSATTPPLSRDPDDKRLIAYGFTEAHIGAAPVWHPVKKMRYVFWRMMSGCTIADALREISWSENHFWNLIDLKRHGPFREEYKRAKILQGRAFADSVISIAEGRDHISLRYRRHLKSLIRKGLAKATKQKSGLVAKAILDGLLASIEENDKSLIQRNKLQIDAAKWMAKSVNPAEFGEKSSLALGGLDGDGGGATPRPIAIQFIGPDGSVVPL